MLSYLQCITHAYPLKCWPSYCNIRLYCKALVISIFGITNNLKQEFIQLELLDEITCLKYEGKSSLKINSIIRSELIHSFRIWKGEVYVLKTIHQKLRWSKNDPFYIEDIVKTLSWKIILDETTKIIPSKMLQYMFVLLTTMFQPKKQKIYRLQAHLLVSAKVSVSVKIKIVRMFS